MIIIHSKDDIKKVKNAELKKYLRYSFSRMTTDILENYKVNGSYFVVVESYDELTQKSIKMDNWEIASIKSDEFFNCIELVEVKEKIMEILVQFSTDIAFGLVLEMKILPTNIQDKLIRYKQLLY